MKAHDPEQAGEFTWSELVTTDHQAAFGFYSQIFGWRKSRELEMGHMGTYLVFNNGGVTWAECSLGRPTGRGRPGGSTTCRRPIWTPPWRARAAAGARC
jgi:hypothetical protein